MLGLPSNAETRRVPAFGEEARSGDIVALLDS
jgi:hypothetical protein